MRHTYLTSLVIAFTFLGCKGVDNAPETAETVIEIKRLSHFISIIPGSPTNEFRFPDSTHQIQQLIGKGDQLSSGETMPTNLDFTGYVPINESSTKGYLSVNSEYGPGKVAMLNITLNDSIWEVEEGGLVNFSTVNGTRSNCSGTVTPWNTIITCEEITSTDINSDGYKDLGWAIEIDPATRKIIDHPDGLENGDKLWALGNFKHENAVVHSNLRTVYQGVDDPIGYLYKFVADEETKLHKGKLYVYKGPKSGSGEWILLKNDTPHEQNTTLAQSDSVGATIFNGIEDVEIGPDGGIYFAVKGEDAIYKFYDKDPLNGSTTQGFMLYAGQQSYDISVGTTIISLPWGTGCDNLAFDNEGNLWVNQDGDDNYIWVIEEGHTTTNPKVKLFGQAPLGSESTGITFTPDNKFMFLSIQHPSSSNLTTGKQDIAGNEIRFNKDKTIIISLK